MNSTMIEQKTAEGLENSKNNVRVVLREFILEPDLKQKFLHILEDVLAPKGMHVIYDDDTNVFTSIESNGQEVNIDKGVIIVALDEFQKTYPKLISLTRIADIQSKLNQSY